MALQSLQRRRNRFGRWSREGYASRLVLCLSIGVLAMLTAWPAIAANSLRIESLSNRPDKVSGGDVLAMVHVSPGTALGAVTITRNGKNVTGAFSPDPANHALTGLVTGMRLGKNKLAAKAKGAGTGKLEIQNYPITGPVFSAPHQTPFICETEAWGLGPALDANCSANTMVAYLYRSTAGTFRPYDPTGTRPADLARTTTSTGERLLRRSDGDVRIQRRGIP